MSFKAPKQRIDAYLNTEQYLWFFKYCEKNYCKNATAGVISMIESMQHYSKLVRKIREEQDLQQQMDLKNAEVIKK